MNLFLLPFTSHCSMQNIGFSDSGYVIKYPEPSSAIVGAPPFTRHLLEWVFCFYILAAFVLDVI